MNSFSILAVDDDPDFLKGLIRNLKKQFTQIRFLGASSGEEALDLLRREHIGVMLTDLQMPEISGHDLLLKGLEINPHLCVIMITGHGTVENAVSALKKGAWDFISKPVDRETLYHTVERAMEHYTLASENKRLQEIIKSLSSDLTAHWESRVMKQLREKMSAIAVTDYTVLVTGESGCGKEYIAKAIHALSKRKQDACHSLNCPAIPEQLLESELFGHVKGAFTGAERNRDGFFMMANKGTLILDEIGDIGLPIQAKLLKFLQDKEVKPVGSSLSKTTDVRIMALTNQNLENKILDGSFRQDLYYRLNVLSVKVPPLRERKEDIPMLVREFVLNTCGEMGIPPMEIDPLALSYLSRQAWPGNVRELLNYVRRMVVFSNGKTIDLDLINLVEGDLETTLHPEGIPLYKDAKKQALDLFSKNYLTRLLEQTRGNISETSRLSGIERASIQKIINRLHMDISRFRST
ncbi:MAG: sigma-54 dependent transcriptional regulator [Proteobacteria bacterium]|nr:sigma-54-dependent Fis family transcriptional regulator [Desulfobacula sp.]MBU4133532.1 sigma-54 dependent transcriptional regulator [Pseudomonadota bacterium]